MSIAPVAKAAAPPPLRDVPEASDEARGRPPAAEWKEDCEGKADEMELEDLLPTPAPTAVAVLEVEEDRGWSDTLGSAAVV